LCKRPQRVRLHTVPVFSARDSRPSPPTFQELGIGTTAVKPAAKRANTAPAATCVWASQTVSSLASLAAQSRR
jgi:hypothetical protein